MLRQEKLFVEKELQLKAIKLREYELAYFADNLRTIAGSATMFGGFAYGALTRETPQYQGVLGAVITATYLSSAGATFAFNLLAVFLSTYCNIFGPGLALRGPEGSMDLAVEGMSYYKDRAFIFYRIGMGTFVFTAILYSYLTFPYFFSIPVITALVCISFGLIWYACEIHNRFQVPDAQLTTGKLTFFTKKVEKPQALQSFCMECGHPYSKVSQRFCARCGCMAERVQNEQYMDSETPKEALLSTGAPPQPMQSVVRSSTSETGSQDSHMTKKTRSSEQKSNGPKPPGRGNSILESVFGDGN
jgi:hypothetical protein